MAKAAPRVPNVTDAHPAGAKAVGVIGYVHLKLNPIITGGTNMGDEVIGRESRTSVGPDLYSCRHAVTNLYLGSGKLSL